LRSRLGIPITRLAYHRNGADPKPLIAHSLCSLCSQGFSSFRSRLAPPWNFIGRRTVPVIRYESLLEQPVDENVAPSRHSGSGPRLPGGAHCGTSGRTRSSTRSGTVCVERDLTLTDRQARISIEYERKFLLVRRSKTTFAEQPKPSNLVNPSDEVWMEEALRCAQRALEMGEVPVGAVVVREGQIVGRGWNRNISESDPSAHAEIIALRSAGGQIGNHRLEECDLFVTIEPCAMCAGAMVHARIRRLVYGSDDPKAGAVHSVMQVLNHPQLNHKIEVRRGVLAGRSAEVLQMFFKGRR
jgi:tRNA(adenine34) deaminase